MIGIDGYKLGIIGLGQMGGSLALCLGERLSHPRIYAYDINPELMQAASKQVKSLHSCASVNDLIKISDVIIIALPMSGIFKILSDRAEQLKSKAAVTDTGSLKKDVTALAGKLKLTNFAGGHPLAGTEKRAVESWNARLFEGKNYFITSNPDCSTGSFRVVEEIVRTIGAVSVRIDAAEHDEIFATTSNLPHLFAFCLKKMTVSSGNEMVKAGLFSCPSYYGATRIAASDPEMVFQMLWYNRQNLTGSLEELIRGLQDAKNALDIEDKRRFRHFFDLP